ncbi:MAG: 16S rRNA (adenine(1518)-N(6)/adenine(1519)-N(6))-dimethyltransferase RsmA [Acidobacteriota bacterium]|nr:16S rRNA (adenine(1518)-N(6)/adenine(1519)-N(6))-dimethyltransferase RsmA [Acidobacteriota bacterium]
MAKKTQRQLLGQHFLHDKNILNKIIEAIQPGKTDLVIEVGAGAGSLTFPLAERAGRVLAIEKDQRLIPALQASAPENLEIIAGDILELNLYSLIAGLRGSFPTVKMAGNLPYHISTQILFLLLDLKDSLQQAVFLFQKEVAQRIVAQPGNKKYSPLSILLQNYFEAELLFLIKPGAFSPPPAVDSACIRFIRREKPAFFPEDEEKSFFKFLHILFARRRQTLRKNLMQARYLSENILSTMNNTHLESKARAEDLKPETLYQLFLELKK